MRVAYIDPRPVPGDTVEALQIAQNVDAMARACGPTALVTPEPSAGAVIEHLLGRPWHSRVELAYLPDYRERLWAPSRSNALFHRAARRWVARNRPDAVWVRHLRLADALLGLHGAPPLFFETHELFARTLEEQPARSRRKVARLRVLESGVYARSRGLVAITRALAADLAAEYAPGRPILVAPDGFDALLEKRANPARASAEPTILYLGSLHPWKGVDVLVRAMRSVARGRLVVAGGSPESIAPLRALARTEGVSERVEFAGPVAPAQRFDWIAAADICALPLSDTSIGSRYTSPLKLFEYLAAGKPVVATDLPSLREVVTHGADAWLVARADAALYAQAIDRLVADGGLREALGAAARATAARYTWDARARCIGEFISNHARDGAR